MLFWKNSKYHTLLTWPLVILTLLATGCAKKPWIDPLDEKVSKTLQARLKKSAQEKASCQSGFYAEATVSVESAVTSHTFTGFIQGLRPSHLKIVATNPLGQPILAFLTDSSTFQTLNTLKKEISMGKLRSLALKHGLPPTLLKSSWVNRLSGQLPTGIEPQDMLLDAKAEGFWLRSTIETEAGNYQEYYLVSPKTLLLQRLVIIDGEEKVLARIDYGEWQNMSTCSLPGRLQVSELPKGLEVKIQMEAITPDPDLNRQDFSISIPPGYIQHQYR